MEQRTDSSVPKPALDGSKLWRKFKVLIFVAPMIGLGALNVLTLVSDTAHVAGVSFLKTMLAPALTDAALSRLLSQSPTQKYAALEKSNKVLESKHVELKKLSAVRSQVVKNISTRVGRRAVANAVKNAASYAAEIIPLLGVPVITTLTASDLYDDCQTLKDLNELNANFDHDKTDENTVCGIKFP